MKKHFLFFAILFLLATSSISQTTGNTLNGKVLFLSSGKKPAVGVRIIGNIDSIENANTVYTLDKGEFKLKFPKARVGHKVNLNIGDKDRIGATIEVVNIKEVEQCHITAKPTDIFEIIVCKKGDRDLTAQRYYNIIKTSSDIALTNTKKELNKLLDDREKDYEKITKLSARISNLEKQTDSLSIYREAFRIASINKDNATQRVLKYIRLLDEGKSIQEAREVLDIKGATKDLKESITNFNAAIEELDTRALASKAIFDYADALVCYDTIINHLKALDINGLKLALYYNNKGVIFDKDGKYEKALDCHQKALDIRVNNLHNQHIDIATSYNNIGLEYNGLGKYNKANDYYQKALKIKAKNEDTEHTDLVYLYTNIANNYSALDNHKEALIFHKKAIAIQEKN